MNNLRDFAMQDGAETTTLVPQDGYSKEGYSKDGKPVVVNNPALEQRIVQRWGVWANASGYFNGRNIAEGTIGMDYRIQPHWLVGAFGSYWYNNRGFAQGGVYTALYENHFWGVLGGRFGANDYTGFGSAGYDFVFRDWLIGPVLSLQYDNAPVDMGFGKGNLFQTRVGGRVAYSHGRFRPEVQVMYENQALDSDPDRGSSIWAGVGASYLLSNNWNLFGGYSFEGNSGFQINEVNLGLRYQF